MEHIHEVCWDGYRQVGMKNKGGKQVPNCVPIDEGTVDDLKNLIQRKLLKVQEKPKTDFKSMTPQERREYMGNRAEKDLPWMPLHMIAQGPNTNRAAQLARYSMSEPMTEDEVNEYCPRCLMEVLSGQHPEQLGEAVYQGRTVSLGKPFRTSGGPKKFSVYVKNKKGNIIKVNFGDPNMKIKKNIPSRRKSFRARHKCHTAKDRTSARYWSCRAW